MARARRGASFAYFAGLYDDEKLEVYRQELLKEPVLMHQGLTRDLLGTRHGEGPTVARLEKGGGANGPKGN